MALDTTAEAARIQTEILRRLGPSRRFELACQMSETVRELATARLRSWHPELDARAIQDLLLVELYGFRRDAE